MSDDVAPRPPPLHKVRLRSYNPIWRHGEVSSTPESYVSGPNVVANRGVAHDDKGESKMTSMSFPLVAAKKAAWLAARAAEAAARKAEEAIASAAATQEGEPKRQAEEQAEAAAEEARIADARARQAAEVATFERDAYHELHATMAIEYEISPRIVEFEGFSRSPKPRLPKIQADLLRHYCLGCGGNHALAICAYVFEDLRGKHFIGRHIEFNPTSVTSRLFNDRMAYDEEFREVVTYLRETFRPDGSGSLLRTTVRDTRYAPASAAGLCPIAKSAMPPR